MKRSLIFSISLAFSLQASSFANDALIGRVEHRSALTRLSRPAMPSKPLGEPLEQASTGNTKNRKSSVSLAASSLASALDKNSFDFKYNPETGRSERATEKLSGKANDSDSDKKMAIEWEQWYKRVQSHLYQIWEDYGKVSGYADIIVYVSKEGDLFNFEMRNFHVPPAERISPNQEELFEHCIERTLNMLDHSEILAFPAGSKRESVPIRTSFALIDGGESGIKWRRDDVEIVPSSK